MENSEKMEVDTNNSETGSCEPIAELNGANLASNEGIISSSMVGIQGDKPLQLVTKDKYLEMMRKVLPMANEDMKKLKKEAERKQLGIYDKNGKFLRLARLDNKSDVKILTQQRPVFIASQEPKGSPNDPKTGLVYLTKDSLQIQIEDFDTYELLPLNLHLMAEYKKMHELSVAQVLTWLPLIPIPVYTSNLYLLLTGQAVRPVMHSYQIMEIYILTLFMCRNCDFVYSRRTEAAKWLDRMISSEEFINANDLRLLKDYSRFTVANIENTEPSIVEKILLLENENDYISTQKIRDTFEWNGPDTLLLHLSEVLPCNGPWEKEQDVNLMFIEDAYNFHLDFVTKQCKELYKILKQILNDESSSITQKYENIVKLITEKTWYIMHSYELCIMRHYGECSTSPIFKMEHRGKFITKQSLPLPNEISESIREQLTQLKKSLFSTRNDAIIKIPLALHENQFDISFKQPKELLDLPSFNEIADYVRFMQHQADTIELQEQTKQSAEHIAKQLETIKISSNLQRILQNDNNNTDN